MIGPDQIEYREATSADVPAMAACRRTDPAAGEADPRMAAYLEGRSHPQQAMPPRVAYVALVNGAVVGYVAGHETRRLDCAGEVQFLFVAPAQRRRGVGSALVGRLAHWFSSRGAVKVCVNVDVDSPAAGPFYRALGAVPLNAHWYVWEYIAAVLRARETRTPGTSTAPTVRSFAPDEWRAYRALRLRALRDAPDAFASTWVREAERGDDEWAARLARGGGSARERPLVAELDGEPCGLAWVRLSDTAEGVAHLYQMWVAPECRRRGVGRVLVDAAIAWARSAGARTLALEVTAGNDAAVRLYAAAGFVPTGDTKPLRAGAALACLTMHRALDAAVATGSP